MTGPSCAALTSGTFVVFTRTIGAGGTLTTTDFTVGSPMTFNTVTSGSNAVTILNSHNIVTSGSEATLDFPGGSVKTIAIVPNTTSGGFRLIDLPRCS